MNSQSKARRGVRRTARMLVALSMISTIGAVASDTASAGVGPCNTTQWVTGTQTAHAIMYVNGCYIKAAVKCTPYPGTWYYPATWKLSGVVSSVSCNPADLRITNGYALITP